MDTLIRAIVLGIMTTGLALGFATLFLPWRVRQGIGRPKTGILFVILFWAAGRFIVTPYLSGVPWQEKDLIPTLVAFCIGFPVDAALWNFLSNTWVWPEIKSGFTAARTRQRARRQADRLNALIPEEEWEGFRRKINMVAYAQIPYAFKDKQQLERALEVIKHLRDKRPSRSSMSTFEREQADQTHSDIKELEEALIKRDADLNKSLAFLDHLTSHLHVARRKAGARVDLEAQMRALIADLHDFTEAQSEAEDASRKLIYLENKRGDKN
jgi:hypothetical protein